MRVLLIFPGALGDLLLLAPAAAALARQGARVELSVRRALGELAAAIFPGALGPAVDGIAMSSLFTSRLGPALADWLRGADVVHAWLGASATTAELQRHAASLGVAALRWHSVERGDGPVHASVAYTVALGVDGLLLVPRLELAVGRPTLAWRCALAERLVIHPGAGSAGKRWTPSGFRRVADGWRARGGEVAILLGPAEEDTEAFWRATDHRVAARLALPDAAALIASAPRYLGNDSGISHLAGALGRTGAVLFRSTRAERWRPLGGALAALDVVPEAEAALAARLLTLLGTPGGL